MDTNNDMLNSDSDAATTTTPLTPVVDTNSIEDSSHTTHTNDIDMDAADATTTSTTAVPGSSSPPPCDAEKGPLGRLSERAYQSALAQKANDNIPSSVRPILKRGVENADRAIAAVDETLQTDEAQRVAGSAVDLFHAMSAFTLMLMSATVSRFETLLNIPSPSPSSTTESQQQQQNQESENEMNNQREKAYELMLRCKSIVLACFHTLLQKKNVSSSSETSTTTSTDDDQQQQEGRYDPHSMDKVVMNNVKHGVHFVKKAGAYSLSQASQFTGPGSSAIAPTADYIISKLPENAQRVVSESSCPFQ